MKQLAINCSNLKVTHSVVRALDLLGQQYKTFPASRYLVGFVISKLGDNNPVVLLIHVSTKKADIPITITGIIYLTIKPRQKGHPLMHLLTSWGSGVYGLQIISSNCNCQHGPLITIICNNFKISYTASLFIFQQPEEPLLR